MRTAVIDLGTNTCNIIIAEHNNDFESATILYRGSEPVRLGKGGIGNNLLLPDSFKRAANTLNIHLTRCRNMHVDNVVAVATSAVRSASNSDDFCSSIEKETRLKLNIISGNDEAKYIFEGVSQSSSNVEGNYLILDIGGGSNEFIVANSTGMIWKESFNLGVARVIDLFSPSDPITKEQINAIRTYFDTNLGSLWSQCSTFQINTLVGCAGAFNTLVDVLEKTDKGETFFESYSIPAETYFELHETLINSTIAERRKMKGMSPVRIEMVIPAIILIELVVEKLKLNEIVATGYALREGILKSVITKERSFLFTDCKDYMGHF